MFFGLDDGPRCQKEIKCWHRVCLLNFEKEDSVAYAQIVLYLIFHLATFPLISFRFVVQTSILIKIYFYNIFICIAFDFSVYMTETSFCCVAPKLVRPRKSFPPLDAVRTTLLNTQKVLKVHDLQLVMHMILRLELT